MKIIIAGAGEVGYHLAKQLSNEEHDISVIDINGSQLERTDAVSDILTITGSSTNITTLNSANIKDTDLVVAVTSLESVNINTAILAKKLGAKRTIARVSNAEYTAPENKEIFKSLGIDDLIYPEELAALEVEKLIERAAATDVLEFGDGKISLLGLKIDSNAPIGRKSLEEISEMHTEHDYRIVAIHRGMRTIIPCGKDLVMPNDQIFVISTPDGIEEIIKLAGKEQSKIENIMILGGGKIGRKTAKLIEDTVNVKLIESNKDKSIDLADYLQKALIIQGDGRDLDLLAQEGIVDMDGFIAVTNDAETNIITCLMAKHLGVKKTIALIDNVDYIPLTQTIGLDSLINNKLIAANNISRFIKKANIVSLVTLQGIDAVVLEYKANPKSPVTKKPVKDIKFPENAIIGGLVRNGEGFITVGDTQIMENDKVVVFALPASISKVEKLFQ